MSNSVSTADYNYNLSKWTTGANLLRFCFFEVGRENTQFLYKNKDMNVYRNKGQSKHTDQWYTDTENARLSEGNVKKYN
jgi:hypothetical protein